MQRNPRRCFGARLATGLGILLVLSLPACGEGERPAGALGDGSAGDREERPATRTDTVLIEGAPEPITTELYRPPDDFPLPFTTYVPQDMHATADPSERTAHFTAAFDGARNEDAFIHLYVFPPDTPEQEAIALARGYKAAQGIPVSRGIEIISDELRPPELQNAVEAFRFRYQSEEKWFGGIVGVARLGNRHYMLVRHYPLEYGDGFIPRADLIFRSWEWADGSELQDSTAGSS